MPEFLDALKLTAITLVAMVAYGALMYALFRRL
jgi:hypothetical protein